MGPSDTTLLINRTELEVAAQWAAAHGDVLAHSRGFSFRRPSGVPAAPAPPLRRAAPRVSVVLAIVLAFLGLSAVVYANHPPPTNNALTPIKMLRS